MVLLFSISAFWVVAAIDYLPVKSGFDELPRLGRILLLVAAGIGVVWLLGRYCLQRLVTPLKDRSLALLIERHYPQFNESLVTTVEMAERDQPIDSEMLRQTGHRVLGMIEAVEIRKILNARRLHTWILVAVISAGTIFTSIWINPDFMNLAARRLYLLDDEKWPRQYQIEVVGIKIKRDNLIEGIEELGQTVKLEAGQVRVAKGASVTILVRAKLAEEQGLRFPMQCTFRFQTADGGGGQQPMKRVGSPRDGYQMYTLDEPPLRGILTDISFSIRGGDHRVGPYEIKAVDQPTVVQTNLDCRFPEYLVDEQSMRWTPREISWTGQSQLPQGTSVSVKAKTNKPLRKVYMVDNSTKLLSTIQPSENTFEYPIGAVMEPCSYHFYLVDHDGVVSEQPHAISIEPVEDDPPSVESSMVGIGIAVTPDVRIPIIGMIEDDYATERQWIEIETPNTELVSFDFETDSDGRIDTELDFRKWRQQSRDNVDLPTGGNNTLALVVKAVDRFNLRGVANIGIGDRYELDLVSPGQLLRILERLEVGQRRRLEQILEEMNGARDYLLRTRSEAKQTAEGREPGDSQPISNDGNTDEVIRKHELRLLFAQRCLVQIEKSSEEVSGVASEFENIRLQLINNRVDSEDRKERLSNQIVAPLRLIADQSLQQLNNDVERLEETLDQLQTNPADSRVSQTADVEATAAIQQANLVLRQIDEVLGVLIKYETQNELLEIVREMIRQQKEIAEQTRKERKRKAFEGLLDE